MESFDEGDLVFPVLVDTSSTISVRKLKRLKKATPPSLPLQLADPRVPDSLDMPISPAAASVPNETRTSSVHATLNEGFSEELRPETELDPLFTYQSVEEIRDASSMAESEGKEARSLEDKEVMVAIELKEKTVKRRLSLEDEEDSNEKRKKKGRFRKLEGQNGKPKESIREKRKLEKAKKVELENLHAESQRLLRGTRDASFKPVQLIQKPISLVLEKIRLRKLEMFKRHKIHSRMPSFVDSDCPTVSAYNSNPVSHQSELKETDVNAKASDFGLKRAYQNPTSDTKVEKGLINEDNNLLISLEASTTSYPLTSSLKIDDCNNNYVAASVGGHNISSSEEESDKENIGPNACKFKNMDLSLKNRLAKTFLDDEAVEEDDSDGERMRYQESEEENEIDELEELDELIASGNTEAPIDQEKRNELHQKWLEQQDAAETENVLQRLKCQGHRRSSFIEGDSDCYDGSEDDDDNNSNDNCDDEHTAKCDDKFAPKHRTINTAHQGLKKAKQMISQMFSDANDVYLPSDDEEIERDFIRHHMLKQNEEPSIISPVEDENSRDFFSLIKKLNIAPAAKKRAKASASLFDSLIVSGNSNSISKSSFLNRASNSLPPSHKHGSSSIKTFIFGRDDSNSRSNISMPEINLDVDQNGSSIANNDVTDNKISSSQLKSSINKRKAQVDSETRSSLFNILRQSSVKFESKDFSSNHAISESQAAYKFSAFKLRKT